MSIDPNLYLSRCRSIARRLTRTRPWLFDEAESVANSALDEAIRTFDVTKGKAESHIDFIVGRRVVNFLRSERPKGHGGRNQKPITVATLADTNADFSSTVHPSPHVGWAIESEDSILRMARKLPRQHGAVIVARYLYADCETLDGCASRIGLKVARTVQLHREAIEMLRESMNVA